MNYRSAHKRKWIYGTIGVLISIFCLLNLFCGILKGIYYQLGDVHTIFTEASNLLKNNINDVYREFKTFRIIWNFSPTWNIKNPFSPQNYIFGLYYIGLLIPKIVQERHSQKYILIILNVERFMLQENKTRL